MAIYESYTNDELLTAIRLKGALNTDTNSENVGYPDNILTIATEELHNRIVPLLISAREEYYVTSQSITVVSGTSSYLLSVRAMGLAIRDVRLTKGANIRSLPLVRREDLYTTNSGPIQGVYLEHDTIKVFPSPSSAEGTITVDYYWRPNQMIPTTSCAQISAIDTGTSTVTVSTIPTAWATSDIFDIVSHKNPYINHAISQTGTVSGSDITFSSLPTNLAVYDWISPEGKTPIPQVPFDARLLLITATTANIMHAIGDKGNADRLDKEYLDIEKRYLKLIQPRIKGESKKIVGSFFNLGI